MIASVSMGISSASAFAASRSTGVANTSFETAEVTAEKTTRHPPDVETPQGRVMDPAENLRLETRLYEVMQSVYEGEQKRSEDTTVIDYYSQSVRDLTEQLRTATGSARAQISSDIQAAQEGLAQARDDQIAEQNSFAERRQQMESNLAQMAQNIARFTAQIDAAGATPGLDATI